MQEIHHVRNMLEQIKPQYKDVVLDICNKMGNGMADYIDMFEVETIQ